MRTLATLFILLFHLSLPAQTTFHKKYSISNSYSYDPKLTPLPGNGAIVSNLRTPFTFNNPGIFRVDENGSPLWAKTYPAVDDLDQALPVDDGFLVAGNYTVSAVTGSSDPVLFKISPTGDVLWSKKLLEGNHSMFFRDIMAIPDGFLVSGSWTYDFDVNNKQPQTIITRTDQAGNIIWSKTYFSGLINNTFHAAYVEGDTLYACGNIRGNGCLVKIRLSTGEVSDVKAWGGLYIDDFRSMVVSDDNHFILSGNTFSPAGSEESHIWVMKVNKYTSEIIWSKAFRIPGAFLYSNIVKIPSGGYRLGINGLYSTNDLGIIMAINETGDIDWAKNYSGGGYLGIESISLAEDNGLICSAEGDNLSILKTDQNGEIVYGCCPELIHFEVSDFLPLSIDYSFDVQNWGHFTDFAMSASTVIMNVQDFCTTPVTTQNISLSLCPSDSVEIGGHFYSAPMVVRDTVHNNSSGCDTIKVYNLLLSLEPLKLTTIRFCPGTSVVFDGVEYTQPATIVKMLPATTGCDTLAAYFLEWQPLPKRDITTNFCQGDTIWINNNYYLFPGLVRDTLPGTGNACDTILNYYLNWLNDNPSTVNIRCPGNIQVTALSDAPVTVSYPAVTAESDCPCPDMSIELQAGLPNGSAFPHGVTQVCYSATDACFHSSSCCFNVTVSGEPACDVKGNGCMNFELLPLQKDNAQNTTFRIRLTNNCSSPLQYAAVRLPNGINAINPAGGAVYNSPYLHQYTVDNPNNSPFHSIRFRSLGTGIASGASDVLSFTLPAQSDPLFMEVAVRLSDNQLITATLNTFACRQGSGNRSITAQNEQYNIRVSPNPSSGRLTVDLSELSVQPIDVCIVNAQGLAVLKTHLEAFSAEQTIVLPAEIANGVYFLTVRTAKGTAGACRFSVIR